MLIAHTFDWALADFLLALTIRVEVPWTEFMYA
jgi:hypothetical protein